MLYLAGKINLSLATIPMLVFSTKRKQNLSSSKLKFSNSHPLKYLHQKLLFIVEKNNKYKQCFSKVKNHINEIFVHRKCEKKKHFLNDN